MDEKKKTVYLSGPMTGKKELNIHAFNHAKCFLETQGFTVLNPHDFPLTDSYDEALLLDLEMIAMAADAIAVLPGWQDSHGARREVKAALDLNLDVIVL